MSPAGELNVAYTSKYIKVQSLRLELRPPDIPGYHSILPPVDKQ